MNMLNSLIIEGEVTKEILLKKDAMGSSSGELEIAVSRTYKTMTGELATEVDLFPVVCFGNTAEFVQKKAPEGKNIRVVGRLKFNKWKDETGKLSSRIVIIAEHIEIKPDTKKDEKSA